MISEEKNASVSKKVKSVPVSVVSASKMPVPVISGSEKHGSKKSNVVLVVRRSGSNKCSTSWSFGVINTRVSGVSGRNSAPVSVDFTGLGHLCQWEMPPRTGVQ